MQGVNKKRTGLLVDFAISVKIKESKYLDLARELKKLRNMKVTVIPIVVGILGMVSRELGKNTGGMGNQKKTRDQNVFKMG